MNNSVGTEQPSDMSDTDVEQVGGEVTGTNMEKSVDESMKELLLGPKRLHENIYDINRHVELDFGEVFQAPTTTTTSRRFTPILDAYKTLYTYTQDFIYILWVVLLGWLLSIVWGILFGTFNFLTVWLIQPTLKLVFVIIRNAAALYTVVVRAVLDPIFESIGHALSFIRAGLFVRGQGSSMDVVKTV